MVRKVDTDIARLESNSNTGEKGLGSAEATSAPGEVRKWGDHRVTSLTNPSSTAEATHPQDNTPPTKTDGGSGASPDPVQNVSETDDTSVASPSVVLDIIMLETGAIPDPRDFAGINGPLKYSPGGKGEPVAQLDDMEVDRICSPLSGLGDWADEPICEELLLGASSDIMEEDPPAKKTVHPFHQYYTAGESTEEPPKCPLRRAIQKEPLQLIQRFRDTTASLIQAPLGPHKHDVAEFRGKEVPPTKFTVLCPPGMAILFQAVQQDGGAWWLTPLHPEVVANDRPDMFFVQLTNTSFDTLSNKFIDCSQIFKGDIFYVQEISRKQNTEPESLKRDFAEVWLPKHHNFWKVVECRILQRIVHPRRAAMSMGRSFGNNKKLAPFAVDRVNSVAYFPKSKLVGRTFYDTWVAVDVFEPVSYPGKPLKSLAAHSRVDLYKEIAQATISWSIEPTIIEVYDMEPEEAKRLDSIPSYFVNKPMNKSSLTEFCDAVTMGVHAQLALQYERFDGKHYPTRVIQASKSRSGLLVSVNLPSPASRLISLAKWRKGVHVALDLRKETISALVLSAVQEGDQVLMNCRILHSGYLDKGPEQFMDQELVLRQRKPDPEQLIRLATGRAKPPKDIAGSVSLAVLKAMHGAEPLPSLSIPEQPLQWVAGKVTLTVEQGRIFQVLSIKETKAVAIDCAPGTGKTTAMLAAICKYSENERKAWSIITAMSNAASVQAVKAWKQVGGSVPGVRLITAKNRNRLDAEYQTDYDLPVLWPRIFMELFQRIDGQYGQKVTPVVRAATRHLVHQGFLKDCDIRRKVLRDCAQLTNKKEEPCLTIMQTFLAIHKPRLYFGTVASVKTFFQTDSTLRGAADNVKNTVMDESSQIPRYTLVPLFYNFPKSRCVFLGDSRQLSPFTEKSVPTKLQQIGVGDPFNKAVQAGQIPTIRLNTVFRCPGEITNLISKLYYGNLLTGKANLTPVPIFQKMLLPSTHPLILISVPADETREGTSYSNMEEAKAAVAIINQWKKFSEEGETAAVLSMYLSQSALVSRMLDADVYSNTVDASQGSEFDLVVVLTSRSGNVASCKFLNDTTRINVSLSRCKQGCIVLGNQHALENASEWKRVLGELPDTAKLQSETMDMFSHG
ncbi:hypothetical protein CRE_09800 [Caenorhabditis remanei]|uniref:DNA2/NAM7 helicase-like C-terminal domain-containing protein n=1 Tax=Caenorhabditis remanei TaxID=31234 RepID=E3NDG6_CAERE|nr:hypothetical protein CRE_09800 [Caenorhabditis remanei]